jgi:hypothetical protein
LWPGMCGRLVALFADQEGEKVFVSSGIGFDLAPLLKSVGRFD